MTRSLRAPAGLFDGRRFGFAQVAVVRTPFGDAIHVAGQVAWDADCNIVGPGDIGRQVTKSLENVSTALASVGATLDQVGSLTLFIRQDCMRDGAAIGAALKAAFGDNPPASTWIGVSCLAREEFLVEIEPSAVFLPRAS